MLIMTEPGVEASNEGLPLVPSSIPDYQKLATVELCAHLKRPTTPLEILANIKFILDHDLLLREDFYSKENLERFSGGKDAKLDQTEERSSNYWAGWSVSGFTDIVPEIPFRDRFIGGISMIGNKRYQDAHLVLVRLTLLFEGDNPSLSYENLTQIYGQPDKVDWDYDRSTPHNRKVFKPITHRFGEQVATYKRKRLDIDHSVSLELKADGTLGWLRVSISIPSKTRSLE